MTVQAGGSLDEAVDAINLHPVRILTLGILAEQSRNLVRFANVN